MVWVRIAGAVGVLTTMIGIVVVMGVGLDSRQADAAGDCWSIPLELDSEEVAFYLLINQYRAEHGLKPLKLSTALTDAAKEHSRDLAKWDRISHYGSDGSNPWDRVKRTGYKPRLAAENVGTGQVSFNEVLRGWKESPGHNKNLLLADAREMGLALVQDPKTEFKSFWTLVIGTSM